MKIKTIFRICAALIFIQGIPLFLSLFSPEFKLMLIADAFGANPSADAVEGDALSLLNASVGGEGFLFEVPAGAKLKPVFARFGPMAPSALVNATNRITVGEGAQAVQNRIDGVEQGFLVLLVVLVVGQWLAFHQGQQGYQVSVDPAGFSSHKFRYIGVFLLRHDR